MSDYSDSDQESVDTVDNKGKKVHAGDNVLLPLVPLTGFGSVRYGVLGYYDAKDKLEGDPKDRYEKWVSTWRYVDGYQGYSYSSLRAAENHVGMLIDLDLEKGGKLFVHGMANGGRLGIGRQKKVVANLMSHFNRIRKRGKDKDGDDEEAGNRQPDFSALVGEDKQEFPMAGEDARYQPSAVQVMVDKVAQFSLGTQHGACVTCDGEVWVWGIARHGRLGVGEIATQNRLPIDEMDVNDNYIAKPELLEFKSTKIVMVSCGSKHTLACDEYGSCYSWGSARYGKLGLGADFDQLNLEPPDDEGNQDPYSWHVLTPQKVMTFRSIFISKVYAGHYNSFAISQVEGQPSISFAWGLARYGLLGIGPSPGSCCYQTRFDPNVGPDDCEECKKRQVNENDSNLFEEMRVGHTEFSRVRVCEPSEIQKEIFLKHDPDDPYDKYIPFPVEIQALSSVNVQQIIPGQYHHMALSASGQVWAWGLMRHGRCGMGKFDPESKFNVKANKVLYDKSVKSYLREERYVCNFRGQIKYSINDPNSWYLPTPQPVEGMLGKYVVSAACGELHSAAVTDDGRLYTWGCARHGRLGTKDPWDDLLLDSGDPEGRYRAEPKEVPGLLVSQVACTSCSTLVLPKPEKPLPEWLMDQMEVAQNKGGMFGTLLAGTLAGTTRKKGVIPGREPAQIQRTSTGASQKSAKASPAPKPKKEFDFDDDDDDQKKGCVVA